MHKFTETKAVTLSLITDDIDGWYEYAIGNESIKMRSEEISDTDRYRAFVAYDPEGYYLEWDVFKAMDENVTFVKAINAK